MTKIRPDSRMIRMQSNYGRMSKPGKIGPLKREERAMEEQQRNLDNMVKRERRPEGDVPKKKLFPVSSKEETQMIEGLIALLVVIIVVGIVAAIIIYLLEMLPIDPKFIQIAKVLVLLIAVLVILAKALPLLGMSIT